MALINNTVLMSGADYFTDKDAINALMDSAIAVDRDEAIREHDSIVKAFKQAGIKVIKVEPPKDCQDGIYTANWGLVRNGKVLVPRLPNKRQPEEPYIKKVMTDLGLEVIELPKNIRAFSGQGDSLAVDDVVFMQSPYRTSKEAHPLVKELLGYKKVYSLRTKPSRWFKFGPTKRNRLTSWPDSPTYDLDLALAIIRPASAKSKALIAYCPAAFKRSSRKLLKSLGSYEKIIIPKGEAYGAFAANLVSTGETVIMSSGAPKLRAKLEKHGLKVIELDMRELKKGGGSIRCSSLTIG